MIKKIHKSQLKMGMYIHDLNCGWLGHNFWRTRFALQKESDLAKIMESAVGDLYIDTERGLDADAPSAAEADAEVEERLHHALAEVPGTPMRREFREEIAQALSIQNEANQVVTAMLDDVRLGRQLEVERMEPAVARIADSLLRNPGALLSLNRIKQRDTYTFQHCVSVATLLVSFARSVGMPPELLREAGLGGMVHDIGKMRVPDEVLNKPGKLTDAEFAIMKSHVQLGMDILVETPDVTQAMLDITGHHHERMDGTGYPYGLKGTQISDMGRMAAIVDVYDAITSNRVYHVGMEPALALRKLFEWSEHHLDPELVQKFIQAVGIYPVGSLVRLQSRRLAVVIDQSASGLLHPIVRIVYDLKGRRPLPPKDLPLDGVVSSDVIEATEKPELYGIDPFQVLTLDPARV